MDIYYYQFFVAIGILFFQYTIYREFTGSLFDGFWRKLLFGIFIIVGVILFLGILITIDTTVSPLIRQELRSLTRLGISYLLSLPIWQYCSIC